MSRVRFHGAMHPRHALRFPATVARAPRHRKPWLDALTAIALGALSGVGLVLALSQGV
jgi:hypothetical protein